MGSAAFLYLDPPTAVPLDEERVTSPADLDQHKITARPTEPFAHEEEQPC